MTPPTHDATLALAQDVLARHYRSRTVTWGAPVQLELVRCEDDGALICRVLMGAADAPRRVLIRRVENAADVSDIPATDDLIVTDPRRGIVISKAPA